MDIASLGVITAFVAGVASFFAPCTLPVLPGFFAFLGGRNAQENTSRFRIFIGSLIFSLGFTSIFVALGVGAQVLGEPLAANKSLFEKIGGILLIVFGVMLTGFIPLPTFLLAEKKFPVIRTSSVVIRDFLFGVTFGFAWTPCIGPILGSILYLATGEKTAWHGGFLLFVFSVGLALPFLTCSLFVPELKKVLKKMTYIARYAQVIMGIILIGTGVLLFTGKLVQYSGILIQKFGMGLVF